MTLIENKTDSVGTYLREIGRIKMLTAPEEIQLARQIQDLMELESCAEQLRSRWGEKTTEAEIAAHLGISTSQLRRRLYLGRKAKNQMVTANLPMVISIAKKYLHRGVDFADLIQEGSLGLIRAAEKFDPSFGYKFYTYAVWWVKQAVTSAIASQGRTIRLPVHILENIYKIKKLTNNLYQSLGRQPTESEIAKELGISNEQLKFLKDATQTSTSLDLTAKNEEEDTKIVDLIVMENTPFEEELDRFFLNRDLNTILESLSEREAAVIRLRYGLDGGIEKSFNEIGRLYNLNRETIRQTHLKALKKIRSGSQLKVLQDYL